MNDFIFISKLSNFNLNHPEKKEGEVLYSNKHCNEVQDYLERITPKFKSVRVGETAFDNIGRVLPDNVPIFVVHN